MRTFLRPLLLVLLVGWSGFFTAFAQSAPPANLSGSELKAWLRQNWYDGKRVDLGYDAARGKMYNYVDNYDNKVTCVYSGYQESNPYSETNTSPSLNELNCEHTVPQSWFNEVSRMKSDIHHLFPTVMQWNSDRGSDPFAEIPDAQTQKWIRLLSSQTSIPTSNIDEYSEDTGSQFEPREDHKGNLARAVFYFYTMHEGQTFDAGKNVVSAVGDLQTLYNWHLKDPADARELERNNRVQRAQGNRNPYIDYPELVARAYGFAPVVCTTTTAASQPVFTEATPTSFKLTWTQGSGDRRLVVVKEGSAVNFTPSGAYTTGVNADYSLATDQGNGQKIVYNNTGNTVTVTGLVATKTYHIQIFEYCSSNTAYSTAAAPASQVTLPDYACAGMPTQNVTSLASSAISTTGFTLNMTAGNGDGRLVFIREAQAGTFAPQAGVTYTGANSNFNLATAQADGSRLVYAGNGTQVSISGLRAGVDYHVAVFESCSNGWQYAASASALLVKTAPGAGGTLPSTVLARQTFETTATDGWEVTSGFSSSEVNTGTPNGQRVHGGTKSLQATTTLQEVIFKPVTTTGYKDLVLELFNSSVSTTTGNGIESGDFLEVYTAINGASFSTTPDIKITGDANDNNARYGMDGTLLLETVAGTPLVKTFTGSALPTIAQNAAPSRLLVQLPTGATSVQVKVLLKTNSDKEYLNIDDVTLYGNALTTTGLAKDLEQQIRVYPNPSKGLVTVNVPAAVKVQGIQVLNAVGQVVHQSEFTKGTSLTLDLRHLPAGVYFLQMRTTQGTSIRRILLN
ncbi:endonuclease [Rufibacter sp. DG15C]|uniref:endonuclease n=1 Tax=Rufibacter sp. DG15C TaxID=1379909 RepID=UPI0009E9D7D0|nr:endonuclease [Rufibacter sp. DG15C]